MTKEVLKTALAQPVQEPVGYEHHEYRPFGAPGEIRIRAVLKSQYLLPNGLVANDFQWLIDQYKKNKTTIKLIPLYTAPPLQKPEPDELTIAYMSGLHDGKKNRSWVGLTDEEIEKHWKNCGR